MSNSFSEGVRPGGLTTNKEIRILLCYLLDCVNTPVTWDQIQEALLGEELANYFVIAESLSQLCEQGLITHVDHTYQITEAGRTVGRTLAVDVPRTVRESAVRSVIRAQQYAAKTASNKSEILQTENGLLTVKCSIEDKRGALLQLEMYMPDELSAAAVRKQFIENGDEVYKLVLATLTSNPVLVKKALASLEEKTQQTLL